MYLLHAKQKVDKEVRRKERAERKRERQKHRERKKLDSYDSLVSSWSDATFNCGYLGSFAVIKGAAVDEVDKEEVKSKLMEMSKFSDFAQPALMTVCIEGVEVFNPATQTTAMAHALSRIAYMAIHPDEPIVGFVAKNPKVKDRYCHVFQLRKQKRAQQVCKRIRKALKIFEMEYELGKAKKSDKSARRKQSHVHFLDDTEKKGKRKKGTKKPTTETIQEEEGVTVDRIKRKSKDTSNERRKSSDKPPRRSGFGMFLTVPKDRKRASKRKSQSRAPQTPEELEAQRKRREKRRAERRAARERQARQDGNDFSTHALV
eukprot:m.41981 g.41981  ORF g.41981 m.41981 type:complete len:317 (+) comp8268_c0_seq1:105-1055(+)